MIDNFINQARAKMEKSLESVRVNLTKLRTGRAHPSLLDQVKVAYYGQDVPLSQVASISTADARTLTVTPWEKDMVAPIEKAIMASDLGLNPMSVGLVIRVPLPALTEDRRRDMVKLVRHEAESGRVAMRNIRRDANQKFKELLKSKDIAEDESRKAESRVQTLTDDFIHKVEELSQEKEKDIMEI